MRLKFWGGGGSIPTPGFPGDLKRRVKESLVAYIRERPAPDRLDEFIDALPRSVTSMVGGNTPCLEIVHEGRRLIVDCGSGITGLGLEINLHHLTSALAPPLRPDESSLSPQTHDILLTHTHWDHIQGFPFFRPIYQPGTTLNIYGDDADLIEQALTFQQSTPRLFPVSLAMTGALINFRTFPAQGLTLGPFSIQSTPLPHPGGSLAYRIKAGGSTMVFATDYEFREGDPDSDRSKFLLSEFLRDADVFVSDTQYTYLENMSKEGWGHSNPLQVVEMALNCGVKRFFLFHHDPYYSDAKLFDMLDMTVSYMNLLHPGNNLSIDLAMEGREVVF